jgi:hypothetical protein
MILGGPDMGISAGSRQLSMIIVTLTSLERNAA